LLVLDLRAPGAGEDGAASLSSGLYEIWHAAAAYGVSFVNIYILWVAHLELMRITKRPDTQFLYLNGCLLLGIGVMPFATSVLAEHIDKADARLAAGIYAGALLWIAAFYNLIWRYLASKPERLLETVSRGDRRRITRTYTITLALYALAFGLAGLRHWRASPSPWRWRSSLRSWIASAVSPAKTSPTNLQTIESGSKAFRSAHMKVAAFIKSKRHLSGFGDADTCADPDVAGRVAVREPERFFSTAQIDAVHA
jgi:uncharacterized membrane protein